MSAKDEHQVVAIRDLVDLSSRFSEIIERVGDGRLIATDVRQAFEQILKRTAAPPAPAPLARDRFTSPEAQISKLKSWSQLINSAWTDEQLERAASDIPEFDEGEPLIPLTLCWTLSTLAASIEAKVTIMRHVYGADRVYVSRNFNFDSKHTTTVSGGPTFGPNRLWWQLIDLGANRFKSPSQVPVATAAGCEIFDVICQHPIYMSQQDGSATPFLDLPGLSVKVRGVSGPDTPDAIGGPGGNVEVHLNWEGTVYPDHAEPVREES